MSEPLTLNGHTRRTKRRNEPAFLRRKQQQQRLPITFEARSAASAMDVRRRIFGRVCLHARWEAVPLGEEKNMKQGQLMLLSAPGRPSPRC